MNSICTMAVFVLAIISVSGAMPAEWPQWRGPERDGVWREEGIVDSFDEETLTPVWSVPVSAGYNGPTVADGRVFVMDRITDPQEMERVHAFDWETGEPVWSYAYPVQYRIDYSLGPRASVTIHDGRAFSLGAMGHLHAFDAATGDVLWEIDCLDVYSISMPIWGISCSPIVVNDMVIASIGGEEAYAVAWDVTSGEERWRALDDPASYTSPILFEHNDRQTLLFYTGDHIRGLDPADGSIVFSYEHPPSRMTSNIATPVVEDDRIFVTSFFDGSLMLRLLPDGNTLERIWSAKGINERKTESLHSMITTPILSGDTIWGLDSFGEFRALDSHNGERLWESDSFVPHGRWATIHLIRQKDRVFVFNENGELLLTRLKRNGYEIIDRALLIEPTTSQVQRREPINWSHPAFAYKQIFARSDTELIRVDMSN